MEHVTNSLNAVSEKDRVNGKLTGLFFITATVTAIIGMLLYDPILKTSDFLTSGAAHSSQIVLGAIFELILVISMAGTAIMLFPYLRKFDGRFALGYLVFRLTEAILILIGMVSVLALLTVSQNAMTADASTVESLRAVGIALIGIHDWTFILGPCVLLGVNTFMYSYVLYRTKLVPRSLASLGIIGAVLILTSGVLAMFNIVPLFTTIAMLLALPVAVYEMVLAGWLVAKGFSVNADNLASVQQTEGGEARKANFVKPILAASLVLIATITSYGQSSHLAVVVTTTDANFNYGNNNSQLKSFRETVRALRAGVSFQAGVTEQFSLVGELYYATKGGTLTSGNNLTATESTLKLYSAELPIMARFHAGRFYINSGPYVSYLFSGRLKTNGPEAGTISFNDTNGFRRFEMGMQGGAGYVFNAKKKKLAVDIRYGYGLTSLSNDLKRYNRMLSISVSMFKPWKKNVF